MGGRFAKWLERVWYAETHAGALLAPLSWIYRGLLFVHRRLAQRRRVPAGVPVIVVGNITVGGTGKTPVVVWLVERLREHGFTPGIVTRGYRGSAAREEPVLVFAQTPATQAGDEAVLLARRSKCPVVACADRVRAVRSLVDNETVDVVVSDDGLQHYALWSDFEMIVVDGARGLGNRRLLPAGPLREPAGRLDRADAVLVNGPGWTRPGAVRFELLPASVVQLSDGERRPLSAFAGLHVHAAAAIGNPERFFEMLRREGCIVDARAFPDHALIPPEELNFGDGKPVLITEKDAVKYAQAMPPGIWSVNVDVRFADADSARRLMQEILTRMSSDTRP